MKKKDLEQQALIWKNEQNLAKINETKLLKNNQS